MSSPELKKTERTTAAGLAAAFFDNLDHGDFLSASLEAIGKAVNSSLAAYICYDPHGTKVCYEVASSSWCPLEVDRLVSDPGNSVPSEIEAKEDPNSALPELFPKAHHHETQSLASPSRTPGQENWLQSSFEDRNHFVHVLLIGRSNPAFQDSENRLIHHVFPRFLKANKYNTLIMERRLQIEEGLPLSKREKEIAALIAEGKTNPQIGKSLSISSRTVEKHCSNIFAKMGFENRNVAVRYFLDFNATFAQPPT